MKKLIILLLVLLLPAIALAEPWEDQIGQPMRDFEIIFADGSGFSLSETLEDKGLVAICLFASWCDACQEELPYLQQAWEEYQDQVAVIGLSVDRTTDKDEKLLEVARTYGLGFPLSRDMMRLSLLLNLKSMPAVMLVDRNGNLVHVETGVPDSSEHFKSLFMQFLSNE